MEPPREEMQKNNRRKEIRINVVREESSPILIDRLVKEWMLLA